MLALESRGLNVEVVDDDDSIISMVTTKGVFYQRVGSQRTFKKKIVKTPIHFDSDCAALLGVLCVLFVHRMVTFTASNVHVFRNS